MNLRTIIENSLSSVMVPLVKAVITFVMSPLIVRALGNYDYGIWEMVFAVVGYMGVLDLGLMPAIVRYVARFHALEDCPALHRIYSSAMAFLFPMGLAMALILLGVAFFAPELLLKGAEGDQHKYVLFLGIVAVQTFVTFTGSLFDCFLEGFQNYKLRNAATIVLSVIGAAVLYPLLKNGGNLVTVAAVNSAGFIIKYAYYGFMLSSPRYGAFRFRWSDASLATLKEMFSFGVKSLIYAISLRISSVTDSLVIGAFLGPSIVTLYIIPYNFISQARNLIWALSRNFMPLFSELDALGQKESACSIFFGASRFMVGIILPLMIGIIMLGPAFLEHWMGAEYAESGKQVLYIIASAYMVQWINPFANRLLTGYGQHGIMARFGIISSLINLAISILLVQFMGKEGVALGTLLPMLVFEPLLLYNTCKVLEVSVMTYMYRAIVPLFVPASVIAITLAAGLHYYPPNSLVQVILMAAVGMSFYLPTFFLCAMTNDERQMIIRKCGIRSFIEGNKPKWH
jgi:O-antigen/teichoic acid export membrane protein